MLFTLQGKHAKGRQYACHSAHVTNVRFSHGDQKLVSTGGADTAVVVWDYSGNTQEDASIREEESDTDSEEEGELLSHPDALVDTVPKLN
jgi:microtubule-associated protein-like 6